ncbi:uncharacterized protein KY384_004854 [Bacidia gigantensis]|uniref:uncharacterized protein n=1 Tax=Bacidia gigantensis TaxID=2732470 RepID=UPI001D03FBD3|nr:uncharacterized protein KY384_004854 [Bacidia gigantensis]KAG8530352.1 hypothetical protein KY384_004854 [Bacidia gigantensis]
MFSCSLGIATLNYLDNLDIHGDPTAPTTREQTRKLGQEWIQYSDFEASLNDAFTLWDATSALRTGTANLSSTFLRAFDLFLNTVHLTSFLSNGGKGLPSSLIMARLTHLLLLSIGVLGTHARSAVLDLIPSNFDDVVLKSGKPALVEFFAPWCGHCKKLAPIYEELATNLEFAKDKVSIAKVDADAEKDLGKRFGVQGFPTLKWFDGKSETPEDYSGGRDLEDLQDFIVAKTGIKLKKKAKPASKVQMLTDSSFKTEIGGNKDVLVAFTAPWCGHCKSLAPIWETLAQDFIAEPSVLVAKVDAEAEQSKATAQDQGVKSYPTIKYFPKGSTTPEPYEGGRSEADFVNFLNTKAGTNRMVGGGLDAKAGTIDALDSIVGAVSGEDLASLSDKVKKATKGLQDKYAEYYVKVAQKLGGNKGYVEKELTRLDGIIKKGGLAPEKLDDLTSRSNILRKFQGTPPTTDEKEL